MARPLSKEEIEDVVSVITLDKVNGFDHYTKVVQLENIRDNIRKQLSMPNIKINPLGINDLKKEILRQYDNALLPAGSLLGLIAAMSLTQPIMQIVLNAFHTAGSIVKGVSAGYAPIIDILAARKKLEVRFIRVLYNKPHSLLESFKFREKYVNISLKTIVKIVETANDIFSVDYVIDTPDNILDNNEIPYWYYNFNAIYDNDNIDILENYDEYVNYPMLRIKLDLVKIFQYKLDINLIYEKLKYYEFDTKKANAIYIFLSPITNEDYIYLDIYPDYKEIAKNNKYSFGGANDSYLSDVIEDFFNTSIIGNLKKISIQGISTIKDYYPGQQRVWAAVKYVLSQGNGDWEIWYDKTIMTVWNIKSYDIMQILRYLKINVVTYNDDYILVNSISNPDTIYKNAVNKDLNDKREYEERQKEIRAELLLNGKDASNVFIVRPQSEFELLYDRQYLELDGYNLENIFTIDEIDAEHAISNDINEIYRIYGIEATRNFIINKLYESINANGEYIDASHIILIADFMTHLGTIVTFNYSGIKALELGPRSQMFYQRAVEILTAAAALGSTESNNISLSIMYGDNNLYGSGYNPSIISKHDTEYIYNRYGQPRIESASQQSIKDVTTEQVEEEKESYGQTEQEEVNMYSDLLSAFGMSGLESNDLLIHE